MGGEAFADEEAQPGAQEYGGGEQQGLAEGGEDRGAEEPEHEQQLERDEHEGEGQEDDPHFVVGPLVGEYPQDHGGTADVGQAVEEAGKAGGQKAPDGGDMLAGLDGPSPAQEEQEEDEEADDLPGDGLIEGGEPEHEDDAKGQEDEADGHVGE